MEFITVFITAPNEDEAARIAHTLVSERLAKCANIVRDIRSIYHWEGKIEDEREVLMIAKTVKDKFQPLVERVKSLHSYKVPEVIAMPIIDGSSDYIDWLASL